MPYSKNSRMFIFLKDIYKKKKNENDTRDP